MKNHPDQAANSSRDPLKAVDWCQHCGRPLSAEELTAGCCDKKPADRLSDVMEAAEGSELPS